MDETIVCPNCGEINSADLPFCGNCQWRLHSLDSEWGTDQAGGAAASPDEDASEAVANDSLPEWLRKGVAPPLPGKSADEAAAARLRERLEAEGAEDLMMAAPAPSGPEDLLAGLTRAEQSDEEPIPDWVARIMGISEDDDSPKHQSSASSTESGFTQGVQPSESSDLSASDEPPWRDFAASFPPADIERPVEQSGSTAQAEHGASGGDSDDIYAWLRQLDQNNAAPAGPILKKDVPATTDVPTWVDRMMGVSAEGADEETDSPSSVPDWLKTAAQDEYTGTPPLPTTPEPTPPLPETPVAASMDWDTESAASQPSISEVPVEPPSVVPTPALDALDVDAVFAAMDMPQWSSSSPADASSGLEGAPPAARDAEPIAPADLPSWVQAMRPVESPIGTAESPDSVPHLEVAGPLLGLNGVLPSVAGVFAPSSRPVSQAMRLDVTEHERLQARFLEDLLEAESRPMPLQGTRQASAPRLIRWLVGGIVLGSVVLGLVSASNRFPFPAGVPSESNAAVQVVQNLAPDSAVLAVFDYEPATAGEMEVAGAALLDHLLLLKHPRLALISTSPTGSALAEHFITATLRERSYVRDAQYVDLGFLPGGLAGAQLFAQNPRGALPYGAATESLWESPVLRGIEGLSNFGAIIVLTDSQETGTVWIEQTTGRRGAVPLVIVASAQAGPTLLPYYDSRQLQGLVIGINGAAGAEVANAGNPGLVRRYWDAYNIGVYSAVVLLILGSIWQILGAAFRRGLDRN